MNRDLHFIKSIKKGVCAGIILACIINLWAILLLYTKPNNFTYYCMAIVALIINYVFLYNKQIKYFFVTLIFWMLTFVVTASLFELIGIVHIVFKHNETFPIMSDVDGLVVIMVYMYSIAGSLIGTIIAFIVPIIKRTGG